MRRWKDILFAYIFFMNTYAYVGINRVEGEK